MTDILTKLREGSVQCQRTFRPLGMVFDEAADEIERLRGWLEYIESGAGLTGDACRSVAAAALDGKSPPAKEPT